MIDPTLPVDPDRLDAAATEGLVVIDSTWRIRFANPAASRLSAKSAAELTGACLWDVFPAAGDGRLRAQVERAVAGRECVSLDFRHPATGTWFALTATPAPPVGFVLSFREGPEPSANKGDNPLYGERQCSSIVEALGEGVIFRDRSGSIRACNAAAERILGLDRKEILGQKGVPASWRAVHEDGSPLSMEQLPGMVAVHAGTPSADVVIGIDREIGRRTWLSVQSRPLFHSGDTQPYGAVSLFADVTARKRTEALQQATVPLLHLLNTAGTTDDLVNGVMRMLLAWSGCEAVGLRLSDGEDYPYYETHGFSEAFVLAENSLCAQDCTGKDLVCLCGGVLKGTLDLRVPTITPGGSFWTGRLGGLAECAANWLPGNLRGRCIREGYQSLALIPMRFAGRTLGLIQLNDRRPDQIDAELVAFIERSAGIIAAVLEQHATQAALRRSEERYRLISDNSADVVWLLDAASLRTVFVTPSVNRLLGYTPEEVLGLELDDLLTKESAKRARETVHRRVAAMEAGDKRAQHVIVTIEGIRKDGSIVPVEVAATFLCGESGRVTEIVASSRDISERRRAEQRRVELEEQLRQAHKLESIGRLAGGIAHDFNNLLTVINGYSDVLLAQLQPGDPTVDAISEIRLAGLRAADLTSRLLAFSRKQPIELEPLDLNALIGEHRDLLQRVVGADIEIELRLQPELGCIIADLGQIHQVLMNLAANSRDAMNAGGRLTLETANLDLDAEAASAHPGLRAGPYVRLSVSDTGSGIDESIRHRIFDPFFTTKPPGKGTGLGLSTAHGIVHQFGGEILVENRPAPGIGVRFRILLPRSTQMPRPAEKEQAQPDRLRGSETILVVEDRPEVLRFAASVLRSFGYNVLEASGGCEAMQLVEGATQPIHLALIDMVMPRMSGKEVAERMRTIRAGLRVIFMSGYSETQQEVFADAEYIEKPFTPRGLATRIRNALEPRPATGTILVADDDPLIRRLFRRILTDAGFQVTQAANGAEALALSRSQDFDLVLTDLVMPEREGIETIRVLRARRPAQKIIAVSGAFSGAYLRPAKALGADATLTKPVAPDVLLATVRRVLEG